MGLLWRKRGSDPIARKREKKKKLFPLTNAEEKRKREKKRKKKGGIGIAKRQAAEMAASNVFPI